jgi:hypothetical protein
MNGSALKQLGNSTCNGRSAYDPNHSPDSLYPFRRLLDPEQHERNGGFDPCHGPDPKKVGEIA